MLRVKILKYLKNNFIFEFFILKLPWMQVFMLVAFLFQEIYNCKLLPIFGLDDVMLGSNFWNICKQFYFWILHPKLSLDVSFHARSIFISRDIELNPFCPLFGLDDVMRGSNIWNIWKRISFLNSPYWNYLTCKFLSFMPYFWGRYGDKGLLLETGVNHVNMGVKKWYFRSFIQKFDSVFRFIGHFYKRAKFHEEW